MDVISNVQIDINTISLIHHIPLIIFIIVTHTSHRMVIHHIIRHIRTYIRMKKVFTRVLIHGNVMQ